MNTTNTPRRTSDEIRIIRAKADDFTLKLQAIVQAVIALGILSLSIYSVASGKPIPQTIQNYGWIILSGYFGLRSIATLQQRRANETTLQTASPSGK